MTLLEAIKARHSVRRYTDKPLSEEIVNILQTEIDRLNAEGGLHIQLVTNEPKAFSGLLAYGKFSGVANYFVMAGAVSANFKSAATLDERIGYYGEQLVLYAQTLGLNTCWAGLSYTKIKGTYLLAPGEKIVCYIAVGYGQTQGVCHKTKSAADVSNVSSNTPLWFNSGVEAALLAPTAVNQQKFRLLYRGGHCVAAERHFSLVGYTRIDLGIVKRHFEIGAGEIKVEWMVK